MTRNPLGWHYPAGAEHDPRAPYNQVDHEILDPDEVASVCGQAMELFDSLTDLKNQDPSWFRNYNRLSKVLVNCQAIIDALQQTESEILGEE